MTAQNRHNIILEMLRAQESVDAVSLEQYFNVSIQTIRSDLRELSAAGLLHRTHGGARRVISASNRDYSDRRKLNAKRKERIGALAASLIPNNCSITLNIGTTTETVARSLSRHQDLVILSNNINIINTFMGAHTNELILVGGAIRQSDGAIVGEDAVEFISRYKVDFAIIGASALDVDGSILDYDTREVSVARAILRNARTKLLVCDSTKFERTAPVRICDVSELDYVITDAAPPQGFVDIARDCETEIMTVEDDNGI